MFDIVCARRRVGLEGEGMVKVVDCVFSSTAAAWEDVLVEEVKEMVSWLSSAATPSLSGRREGVGERGISPKSGGWDWRWPCPGAECSEWLRECENEVL